MAKSRDHKDRWQERSCEYCGTKFYKAPTYMTCGHPRCVKLHRKKQQQKLSQRRDYTNKARLPNWEPPDIYAPDTKARNLVAYLLELLDAENLSPKDLPPIIQTVAMQAKVKPAEVLEIWKSTQREKEESSAS